MCAKAFVNATHNPIRGSDQTQGDILADILRKLEFLAPADLEAGTYHLRGDSVWKHLRDTVFKDVQKFNEALRLVYLSLPTGVSEEDKINMAVAIHL